MPRSITVAAITGLAVGIAVALTSLALYTILGPPEAPFWVHDGLLVGGFAFWVTLRRVREDTHRRSADGHHHSAQQRSA